MTASIDASVLNRAFGRDLRHFEEAHGEYMEADVAHIRSDVSNEVRVVNRAGGDDLHNEKRMFSGRLDHGELEAGAVEAWEHCRLLQRLGRVNAAHPENGSDWSRRKEASIGRARDCRLAD